MIVLIITKVMITMININSATYLRRAESEGEILRLLSRVLVASGSETRLTDRRDTSSHSLLPFLPLPSSYVSSLQLSLICFPYCFHVLDLFLFIFLHSIFPSFSLLFSFLSSSLPLSSLLFHYHFLHYLSFAPTHFKSLSFSLYHILFLFL